MVAIKTIADALDPMLETQGNKQKLLFSESEYNVSLELLNRFTPRSSINNSTSINISNTKGSGYKITNLFSNSDNAGILQLLRIDYDNDPGTLLAYFAQDGSAYFKNKLAIDKAAYGKKLSLYDLNDNENYQGFAANLLGLNYVTNISTSHIFYAAISSTTKIQLFSINENEISASKFISVDKKNYGRKFIAYDNNNNLFEIQGLKATSGGFSYHTTTSTNHLFFASTSSSAETELLRIGTAGIITSRQVQINNTNTNTGLNIQNTNLGTGQIIDNLSNGVGLILTNASDGTGLLINNTSTGDSLTVNYSLSYSQAFKIDNNGHVICGLGNAGDSRSVTLYSNGVLGLSKRTTPITTEGGLIYNSYKRALQFYNGAGLETIGNKIVILRHVTAAGIGNGITAVVGWNTRTLNNIYFQNIVGFQLNNNIITLGAGVYLVEGRAVAITGAASGSVVHSFYNNTLNQDNLSDTIFANASTLYLDFSVVVTVTTFAEFSLRTRMGSIQSAGSAFGIDMNNGLQNCFASVKITQLL